MSFSMIESTPTEHLREIDSSGIASSCIVMFKNPLQVTMKLRM